MTCLFCLFFLTPLMSDEIQVQHFRHPFQRLRISLATLHWSCKESTKPSLNPFMATSLYRSHYPTRFPSPPFLTTHHQRHYFSPSITSSHIFSAQKFLAPRRPCRGSHLRRLLRRRLRPKWWNWIPLTGHWREGKTPENGCKIVFVMVVSYNL